MIEYQLNPNVKAQMPNQYLKFKLTKQWMVSFSKSYTLPFILLFLDFI